MTRKMLGAPQRTYAVKPATHSPPPKVEATPPAAADATIVQPATPPAGGQVSAPSTATEPNRGSNDSAAVDGRSADVPTATQDPAKLDAAEEAKRLARITRADQKLQAERRTFAEERARHEQSLARVQTIEKAAQLAKTNPLAFMQQAFGVAPQQILDSIITEGAKPEATRAQEKSASEAAELRAKLAEIEKTVQATAQAQNAERNARDVEAYKISAIVPILADATKYELTRRALGDKAADEVFALQRNRYNVTAAEVAAGRRRTPEVLSPAQAADMIERHFRSQRDLLTGASVDPAKPPQTTARTEPPAVQPSGSQTQNQAARTGGFRAPPKPYKVRSIR